jgi:hypothetical protein
MLGNYRVAAQLVGSRVAISSTALSVLDHCRLAEITEEPLLAIPTLILYVTSLSFYRLQIPECISLWMQVFGSLTFYSISFVMTCGFTELMVSFPAHGICIEQHNLLTIIELLARSAKGALG